MNATQDSFLQILEYKHFLEQESKRRAMIYQHDSKMELAEFISLAPEALFHISYSLWCKISDYYQSFKIDAETHWSEHPELYHNGVTIGQIWAQYAKLKPIRFNQLVKEIQKAV